MKNNRGKIITLVVLILVVLLLAVIFMPPLNSMTTSMDIHTRTKKLNIWHEELSRFIEKKGYTPETLFEVIQFRHTPSPSIEDGKYSSFEEYFKSENPKSYNEVVTYGFMPYKSGWSVMELNPGIIYKHRLMIDHNRKVYKIIEVKTEK